MTENDKLRVLIVCAQCDGEDVGESWCGYQWVSRLAEKCDVTILTSRFPGHRPPSSQLPNVEVIEWDAFPYLSKFPRINSSIKPWYPNFYIRVKFWLKQAKRQGLEFDLLHHLTPMAMRYPSPCAGSKIPYIIGPVGGGLPTPDGFKNELGTEPLFARLRQLDGFRLRHDPMMRRTYENAKLVVCSGPYAADKLSHLNVARIELETEVGISDLPETTTKPKRKPNQLHMVHVGRIVRTKGLRDAIRAMAQLEDLPDVTLKIAGDGEDIGACQQEVEELGLSSKVHFLGKKNRNEVEALYKEADLFLFPSFREPTGIVLFEAMRHGLPILTTNLGGPGHIVTDECGVRVPAENPEQLSNDLARQIRRLATDKRALASLAHGAKVRVAEIGLWNPKIERMVHLYKQVAQKG